MKNAEKKDEKYKQTKNKKVKKIIRKKR